MSQYNQPNILLITADQLAPFFIGAYGNKKVRTPRLDRLASEGVRFDGAYSNCPLCAPARASLMTGRYASEIGCYDNSALLSADHPTIAHYLTNAGYDCVASGKMHYIGPDQLHGLHNRLTTDIYPSDYSWVRSRAWEGKPVSFPERLGPAYMVGDSGNHEGIGQKRWNWHLEYDARALNNALEFIRRSRVSDEYDVDASHGPNETTKRKPFFLMVNFHHPHQPFHVPKKYWDLYEGVDIDLPDIPDDVEGHWSQLDRWLHYSHGLNKRNVTSKENLKVMHRAYYGLVTLIDDFVGELLDELEEQGLSKNTVVVFSSDHGDMLGARGMIQKRCFYEQSARVPLIFRFPDGYAAGKVVNDPVSLVDLLPTFSEIGGYPTDKMTPYDGSSVLPIIAEPSGSDRLVFCEQHGDGVYGACFMVRRGKYKYTYINKHSPQLFDIEADPGEWNNLAGKKEFAAIEADLKAEILRRFDPDRIEEKVNASLERRLLIEMAMKINGTSWDYEPKEDVSSMYSRQKVPAPEAVYRSPYYQSLHQA